ncbi:hypothetical protein [Angustibacter aerolatus]|nr:hypothetical protein [Angustibacter aerolatus]
MTALPTNPCRGRCEWKPSARRADPPRLVCRGCGSHWDRTQRWTPIDRGGVVSPAALAERARDR